MVKNKADGLRGTTSGKVVGVHPVAGNKLTQPALKKQKLVADRPVSDVQALTILDQDGYFKSIIETPRGSRNKYTYDPESGLIECGGSLRGGMIFPFDFGFIPSTKAEDGDPIDIIVLMDEPAFPGCLVRTKLVGVMEAEQTEDGKTFRNDRLVGVHNKSVMYNEIVRWQDLPKTKIDDIQNFFITYNQLKGKKFQVLGWRSPAIAMNLVVKALTTSLF